MTHIQERTTQTTKPVAPRLPTAPAGDPAFAPLADQRMYWPILRARLQVGVRDAAQTCVGRPLESTLLALWRHRGPGGAIVESMGLPRRAVERALGDNLLVSVDPCRLNRIRDWREWPKKHHPSSNTFIWDGDWDLRWDDFRQNSRVQFIRDLDWHRDALTRSKAFQRLQSQLKAGSPFRSHQQGVLLDSEARILMYLRAYLGFLDNMAERGFDTTFGKDNLSVAVTRDGRLLKLNRGLHRLAMAQHLGLKSVQVAVKAVHRDWWKEVTAGKAGQAALELVASALHGRAPKTDPEPLASSP